MRGTEAAIPSNDYALNYPMDGQSHRCRVEVRGFVLTQLFHSPPHRS